MPREITIIVLNAMFSVLLLIAEFLKSIRTASKDSEKEVYKISVISNVSNSIIIVQNDGQSTARSYIGAPKADNIMLEMLGVFNGLDARGKNELMAHALQLEDKRKGNC